MSQTPINTFSDVLAHLYRIEGSASDNRVIALARNAVLSAYRIVPAAKRWNYYLARGRIVTDDDYNTGTVAFDFTGGASERLLTFTNATLPTNFARGQVRIDNVEYRCATRESSSTGTLSVNSNPGADVASTSYHWWRDTYPLPIDCQSVGEMVDHYENLYLSYLPFDELLKQRAGTVSPNRPCAFSVISDPDYIGQMAVVFDYPPDDVYNFDFAYRRQPMPLRTAEYSKGTVAVSSTTVTGTGTAFTSAMVGSVIRFGDASNVPTGLDGAYPFVEQRIVTARASATSLTIDAALDGSYSGVKYSISDPIDIEEGAMYSAFLRCCEAELARSKRDAMWKDLAAEYERALAKAREADARYFGPRNDTVVRSRFYRAPKGADQGA